MKLARGPSRNLKDFPKARGGATAIEFALVATPLFFLLFAIIEIGLVFVLGTNLSNATLQVSRQIRTGAIIAPGVAVTQGSGTQVTLPMLKTTLCSNIGLVPPSFCATQIQVDMRVITGYQGQTVPNPISGSNFSTSAFCFYSGTPGSIVEMRTFFLWPIVTPILLSAMVNATSVTSGGSTTTGSFNVAAATEVFQNEPNANETNTGNGC